MRQVPIPNNNSANEFGVELDKTLTDGSHALGIVRITDMPSPYNSDAVLLVVNAWQVTPEGRPVQRQTSGGVQPSKVAIREMLVSVPRGEYIADHGQKQIAIAAAALELEAGEIPAPVTLPVPGPEVVTEAKVNDK